MFALHIGPLQTPCQGSDNKRNLVIKNEVTHKLCNVFETTSKNTKRYGTLTQTVQSMFHIKNQIYLVLLI